MRSSAVIRMFTPNVKMCDWPHDNSWQTRGYRPFAASA